MHVGTAASSQRERRWVGHTGVLSLVVVPSLPFRLKVKVVKGNVNDTVKVGRN